MHTYFDHSIFEFVCTVFQNLEKLANLKLLSIQSNRITVIEGLDHLTLLEELYISHNGIKCIQGLEKLVSYNYVLCEIDLCIYKYTIALSVCTQVNLSTLDLANNQIKKMENISHLVKLEEFWVKILLSDDTK